MSNSFLLLNYSKSEIVGPPNSIQLMHNNFDCLSINVIFKPESYCVITDLSFDAQIKRVVQSCFLHLKTFPKLEMFCLFVDLEKVIPAFIYIMFV